MKKILLITATLLSFLSVYAQSLMTVGQVYDFNVNDEFQFHDLSLGPPNAIRIKIIGKYYSTNSDTVFYVEHYDNYVVTGVDPNPTPHNIYSTNIGIDTVFYTNLGDTIRFSGQNDSCDSYSDSISFPTEYCGRKTYSYDSCINTCSMYTEVCQSESYSEGLGIVYHYYLNSVTEVDTTIRMFYYKKDSMTCGTKDTTVLSINEIKKQKNYIKIFPNPANNNIRLDIGKLGNTQNATVRIYDETGRLVKTASLQSKQQSIDISALAKGIYQLLIIEKDAEVATGRFVKE